jgi:hypothetical protein
MHTPKTTKKITHLLSLPLSAQIRAFVGDARKIFALPNFKEKMSTFGQRSKKDEAVCLTCIGGAALAARDKRAFRSVLDHNPVARSVEADTAMKLGDEIRVGMFHSALNFRALNDTQHHAMSEARNMVQRSRGYRGGRGRAPWRTYLKAADQLEAVGL